MKWKHKWRINWHNGTWTKYFCFCFPNEKDERDIVKYSRIWHLQSKFSGISDQSLGPSCAFFEIKLHFRARPKLSRIYMQMLICWSNFLLFVAWQTKKPVTKNNRRIKKRYTFQIKNCVTLPAISSITPSRPGSQTRDPRCFVGIFK